MAAAVSVASVLEELVALAKFYSVDDEDFEWLAPWLSRYAEFALGEDHFEVLTGGRGGDATQVLPLIAKSFGAPHPAVERFLDCAEAFPARMLWLKLGRGSPTLYVRAVAPMDEALRFLRRCRVATERLEPLLRSSGTMYALGFSEDGVKTYTIVDVPRQPFAPFLQNETGGWPRPGFLSLREPGDQVKIYLPEVPWDRIRPASVAWEGVLQFGAQLGFRTAGHLAVSMRPGRTSTMKLYVERRGAIPNDYRAR